MSLGFNNIKIEGDDQYASLLQALNDWRNINDVVRHSIKALYEVIRTQGNSIKELEKQLSNKASKNELNSGLNIKANVADVMRTFSEVASSIESRPTVDEINCLMDEKVSKNDFQYILSSKPSHEEVRNIIENKVNQAEFHSEISSLNLKYDEFYKDFIKKSASYVTNKEILQLNQALELKANLNDVNEALSTKASKESVINALHRKANKNELDTLLKNKVDLEEIQNVFNVLNNKSDISDLEKLRAMMDLKADKNEVLNINSILNYKLDTKDFDDQNKSLAELTKETDKKIDDIDKDIDKLIENIKKEFGNINKVINNLDMKKSDYKEIEKLNNAINKKCDVDNFNDSLVQLKKEILDNYSNYKTEYSQARKNLEDYTNEKFNSFERNFDKISQELILSKERFNDLQEKRKLDQDEFIKLTKSLISNTNKDILTDIDLVRSEIQRCSSDFQELYNRKLDRKEFDATKIKLISLIDQKLDVIDFESLYKNIQKELFEKSEETRLDINKILKSFESDVTRSLEKKANLSDIDTLLNIKNEVNQAMMILDNKANIAEFDNLRMNVDNLTKDLINKIDYEKFDTFINDTRLSLDDIQKDLMMKANIKEMINMLKNKPDLIDINNSITKITEELDQKCTVDKFNIAMNNQAIINDALCSENCLARWYWKSGQVKNGFAIPWEIQTVNTAPDIFFWEKDKTTILVVVEGIYEVTLGIYASKKPTVQILLNGEPVISAVNSSSYLIHHSGNKTKSYGKFTNTNVTGLTMIDYICIPEKSRIAISYSGEEGGEGFFGMKKI